MHAITDKQLFAISISALMFTVGFAGYSASLPTVETVCHDKDAKKWESVIHGVQNFHTNPHIEKVQCDGGAYFLDVEILTKDSAFNKIITKLVKNPLFKDNNNLSFMDKLALAGDFENFYDTFSKMKRNGTGINFIEEKGGESIIKNAAKGGNPEIFNFVLDNITDATRTLNNNFELVKFIQSEGNAEIRDILHNRNIGISTALDTHQQSLGNNR